MRNGAIPLSCPKRIIIGKPTCARVCPAGQEIGTAAGCGLCYDKCGEGWKRVGPVCWEEKPEGWVNCGLGAAAGGNACAQAVSDQVFSVLQSAAEVTLAVATAGGSTLVTQAQKLGAKVGVKVVTDAKDAGKLITTLQKVGDQVQAAKKQIKAVEKGLSVASGLSDTGTSIAEAVENPESPQPYLNAAFGAVAAASPAGVVKKLNEAQDEAGDNLELALTGIEAGTNAMLEGAKTQNAKQGVVQNLEKAKVVLEVVDAFAPFGVAGIAAAYLYPKCSDLHGPRISEDQAQD